MVIDNPFDSKSAPEALSSSQALASPPDRLAAVIVDYFLLIPFISLALAPLKRVFFVGQLLGDEFFYHFESFFAVLIFLVVCLSYQTLFIYWKGATPGKLLLKLRVISVWPGRKISLFDAFMRAVVWWIDTGLLMIPHLAVATRFRRRPFHDRIADTVVVTHRWQAVGEPTVSESSLARSLIRASLLIGSVTLISTFLDFVSDYQKTANSKDDAECSLDAEIQASLAQPIRDEEVLEKKLSLFVTGNYGPECLISQADRVLTQHPDNGTAYIAKALANSSDAETMAAYLREACASDQISMSCAFGHVLTLLDQDDWKQASERLAGLVPESPDYMKFWAMRQFFNVREYERVASLADMGPIPQILASYVLDYKARALFLLNRSSEAYQIYQTHLAHLTREDKTETSSWFCDQELLRGGCSGAERSACRDFKSLAGSEKTMSVAVALTDFRTELCLDPASKDVGKNVKAYPSEVLDFARMLVNPDRKAVREELTKLATSEDGSPITTEARFALIRISDQIEELEVLRQTWQEEDPFSSGWAEVGEKLMDRYAELGSPSHSFDVGMTLYTSNVSDRGFLRKLANVSLKSDHREAAQDLMQLIEKGPPVRRPASEGEL